MPSKKISQREARQYKKRVTELEAERQRFFASSWPGKSIGTVCVTNTEVNIARTARTLGFGVVAVPADDKDQLRVFAVKP